MKVKLQSLIQKAAEGALTKREEELLKAHLKTFPELQKEIEDRRCLQELLTESIPDSFDPYFATRVMQRINSKITEKFDLTASLAYFFRRIAIASAVIIMAITSYNITTQWDNRAGRSLVELALNLAPATLETSIESITGVL